MQNDQEVSVLNNLIETCKDGELGFKTAAEGLKSSDVKAKFLEYSRERGAMARELQNEVRRLGGDPETSGSMSGSLHRGWLDIKSVVTGKDDHAVVAEAERGEDVAVETYKKALEQPLPPTVESIVRRQFSHVQEAHDRVRALEQSRER